MKKLMEKRKMLDCFYFSHDIDKMYVSRRLCPLFPYSHGIHQISVNASLEFNHPPKHRFVESNSDLI